MGLETEVRGGGSGICTCSCDLFKLLPEEYSDLWLLSFKHPDCKNYRPQDRKRKQSWRRTVRRGSRGSMKWLGSKRAASVLWEMTGRGRCRTAVLAWVKQESLGLEEELSAGKSEVSSLILSLPLTSFVSPSLLQKWASWVRCSPA